MDFNGRCQRFLGNGIGTGYMKTVRDFLQRNTVGAGWQRGNDCRPLLKVGREAVGSSSKDQPVDNVGRVHYDKAPGSRSIMRFEIQD
jgi:hypothetical protein